VVRPTGLVGIAKPATSIVTGLLLPTQNIKHVARIGFPDTGGYRNHFMKNFLLLTAIALLWVVAGTIDFYWQP